LLFSTAPIWLATLIVYATGNNLAYAAFKAAMHGSVAKGELFMYCTALLAPGFRALMRFLRLAYLDLVKPGQVPTREQFSGIFARIPMRDDEFSTANFVPGTSGEVAFFAVEERLRSLNLVWPMARDAMAQLPCFRPWLGYMAVLNLKCRVLVPIGGYWMIQVKSKEEAIEWASRCPASDRGPDLRPISPTKLNTSYTYIHTYEY